MADFGIGTLFSLLGTVVSVASSFFQAGGQRQSGEAQAAAYQYNAALAEQQAQAATQAAAARAAQRREETRRVLGTTRARAGASGIVTEEGSPLLVLLDNAAQGELSALRETHAGQLEALGFREQANLYRFQAEQARRSGRVAAGTTLLTGLGRAGIGAAPLFGGFGGAGTSAGLGMSE